MTKPRARGPVPEQPSPLDTSPLVNYDDIRRAEQRIASLDQLRADVAAVADHRDDSAMHAMLAQAAAPGLHRLAQLRAEQRLAATQQPSPVAAPPVAPGVVTPLEKAMGKPAPDRVNAAKCKACGDYLRSYHVLDRKVCRCGKLSVSGGTKYRRRGCGREGYEEMSHGFAPKKECTLRYIVDIIEPEDAGLHPALKAAAQHEAAAGMKRGA